MFHKLSFLFVCWFVYWLLNVTINDVSVRGRPFDSERGLQIWSGGVRMLVQKGGRTGFSMFVF